MKRALFLTPLAALVLAAASFTKVLAISYDITGNAAGSTSNVTVNQQNSTNYTQNNTSNISNNVNSSCNTGGNSANSNTGGNTGINTGDCSSNINITNQGNNNCIGSSCVSPKPSPKASTPPTGGPGGGGGGGSSSSGESSGGGSSAGGGQTLGATGVAENLALFSLGMTMVLGGLWQVKRVLV